MNAIKVVMLSGIFAIAVGSTRYLSRASKPSVSVAQSESFSAARAEASKQEISRQASRPKSLGAPAAYGDEVSAEEEEVQEERLVQRKQFATQMFAQFQREPVDPNWAPEFERNLYQAAQVDPGRVYVECKATMCRVTLSANSGLPGTPGILDFLTKQGARIKMPGSNASDTGEFELYVMRKQTSSPNESDEEQ